MIHRRVVSSVHRMDDPTGAAGGSSSARACEARPPGGVPPLRGRASAPSGGTGQEPRQPIVASEGGPNCSADRAAHYTEDRFGAGEAVMTGEITLRGKVLQIGGVKEKVLAAHRAGLRTVILPQENERDLEEIPGHVREEMTFHHVVHCDEVLKLALLNRVEPAAVPA